MEKKSSILKPTRIDAFVSKSLEHYDLIKKTKNGVYETALLLPKKWFNKQMYFEFILTPPGTFDLTEFPIPYFGTSESVDQYITHTISKELILIVRFSLVSFDVSDEYNWNNRIKNMELHFTPLII